MEEEELSAPIRETISRQYADVNGRTIEFEPCATQGIITEARANLQRKTNCFVAIDRFRRSLR
jgi:hypothetical protein